MLRGEDQTLTISNDTLACIELLEGHSVFLDMLARLYFKPLGQEELDRIADVDPEEFSFDHPLISEGFGEMIGYLQAGGSTLRQDVNVDYTAAFYGISSYKGRVANPCESVFKSEEGILMQRESIEVFRAYKKEALKTEDDIGVPADHLSFELQFLSIMCKRAAASLRDEDYAEALRNVRVQQEFLDVHVLSWFDAMAEVADKILSKPFYKGVLKVSRGFFEVECADLEDMSGYLAELVAEKEGDAVAAEAGEGGR